MINPPDHPRAAFQTGPADPPGPAEFLAAPGSYVHHR
jgi:hypothetical protein